MQHFAFLVQQTDTANWQAARCTDYRDSIRDPDAPLGIGINKWDAISNLCDLLSRELQRQEIQEQPAPPPAPAVEEVTPNAADQAEEYDPKEVLEPPEYKPTPKQEIKHHNANKARKK